MQDIRQSLFWQKYLESLGWKTEVLQSTNKEEVRAYIRRIPLLGSLIKIPRHGILDWLEIDKMARKNRAILVKLEPLSGLEPAAESYLDESWAILPTKTIQIDLKKTEKELFDNLSKDCRYCLKKALSNQLATESFCNNSFSSDLINAFYQGWKKNAREKKFWVPFKKEIVSLWEVFGKNAWLVFIKDGENILAGALMLVYEDTAYYMHAFSTSEGRKLNASYLLIWEAIRQAKKLKLKILDLEGIYDERFPNQNKKWRGFSHFKKSFGGWEIEYPGSFSKYYSFWKYFFALERFFRI